MITSILLLAALPDVLDVGPGPGAYPQIAGAVQAAADGDVLRVAPGVYDSFAVRRKGLTILGGPGVVVEGVVRVQELLATQSVNVHGLTLRLAPHQGESRLIIGYNAGPVRLEGIVMPVLGSDHYSLFAAGARVLHSQDVIFSRCELGPMTAWDDWFNRFYGSVGLACVSSNVSLFDCGVVGQGSENQSAIAAGDSTLELFGSRAFGGGGGHSYLTFAGNCRGISGTGGDGVSASASTVLTVECDLRGGSGGYDGCWAHATLPSGLPIRLTGGAVHVEGPGTAPLLEVPNHVREGDSFTLQAHTEVNDIVLLLAGSGADRLPIPGLFGALLVDSGQGYRRLFPGQSGSFQVSLTAPDLPAGMTLGLHFQLACLRPDPGAAGGSSTLLGATEVVTILDSAF